MAGSKKKPRLLNKGFPHKKGGNCWEGIQSASAEDVCMKHEEPRGECSGCPRCPACDNMDLAAALAKAPEESQKPTLVLSTQMIRPSASKTDRLIACTWWAGKTVTTTPVGERTRFGSAFHELLANAVAGTLAVIPRKSVWDRCAKKWSVDAAELQERVQEAVPVLRRWLEGENVWGIDFSDPTNRDRFIVEGSIAYDPEGDSSRSIPNPSEDTHEYQCEESEIPGTVDIAAMGNAHGKKWLLVEDHKSGWDVAQFWQEQTPGESGQLRTLALSLDRLHGPFDLIIVAYGHFRSGSTPIILADELTRSDLEAHRKTLRAAMRNVGSGWLRSGPWCAHCTAFAICPTQSNALVELKRTGPMTRERVGAVHEQTQIYDALREQLRAEMRAWIRLHGPAIRPTDGRSIDIVTKTVARLSQASIIRALGSLKGKKEIERLRKLGCIEKKEQEEIRVGGAR